MKNLNQEKLIVALDFPDFDSAKKMVDQLGDEVSFFKIGLEMMMSGDYFKMINFLKEKEKKIFADLKLYDIPETVAKAIANLAKYDIDLTTIHSANREIMLAASENKRKMQVIAVTILTSLSSEDLLEIGFDNKISLEDIVLQKADLSLKCGIDGVVASALETQNLRQNLGKDFIIVTPGIRVKTNMSETKDDQKRVADVASALKFGSSYLVVGRPITRNENPRLAAQEINKIILENSRCF